MPCWTRSLTRSQPAIQLHSLSNCRVISRTQQQSNIALHVSKYVSSSQQISHSGLNSLESTFDLPCVLKEGGFDTGLQDTGSANTNTGATFNLIVRPVLLSHIIFPHFHSQFFDHENMQVNDTQPLWFFSSANNDCKSGMVLAVNPPTSGQTAAAFRQNAEASTATPSTSAQPTPSASDGQSSTPVGSPAPSPTGSNVPQNNGALSRGARIEFVYAGIVAFLGSSFVLFYNTHGA